MNKIILLFLILCTSQLRAADWSESYGGDGVVAGFIFTAKSLLGEMEQNPESFSAEFVEKFRTAINETQISSADKLILNNVEKDAINYTLHKPYRIEVSRNRWLQYENSIFTQEKLVLHEYLFAMRINDSDYSFSNKIYRFINLNRMANEGDKRLGPYLLQAASECNEIRFSHVLSLGANLNYTNSNNENALYMAVNSDCIDLAEKLLDQNVPPLENFTNSQDPFSLTFIKTYLHPGDMKSSLPYKILWTIYKYYMMVDANRYFKFDSEEFPPQIHYCEEQTLLMRAIIGITVYEDESKTTTKLVRNLQVAETLRKWGASFDDSLKDSCGNSARDYARMYQVDLVLM